MQNSDNGTQHTVEAIISANESFYQAFSLGDIVAMGEVWSRQEPVICIHPGWMPRIGREQVMASWQGILASPGSRLRCVTPYVKRVGEVAIVIAYEVMEGTPPMAVTNMFRWEGHAWRMFHHQSSTVREQPET